MSEQSPAEGFVLRLRWRTGRKVGRTIYAQFGPEPDDRDALIGTMDTVTFAAHLVYLHNKSLGNDGGGAGVREPRRPAPPAGALEVTP